jgi:hypothetical protein
MPKAKLAKSPIRPRKPQRPRLERKQGSCAAGWILTNVASGKEFVALEVSGGLTLKDARRLHAFFTKAIKYLESK